MVGAFYYRAGNSVGLVRHSRPTGIHMAGDECYRTTHAEQEVDPEKPEYAEYVRTTSGLIPRRPA